MPGNILGLQARRRRRRSAVVQRPAADRASSVAIGIAALKVGEPAEPFLGFIRSALAIVQKVLWWVILLAPIGTRRPDRQRRGHATAGSPLGSLGVFAGAVYAGLALVLFVVYPVLLRLHGLSPLRFFAGAWPAIQLAFVSRSSIGTLPVTERVTEQNLGVPRSYASFAVPLGATTKMDGCAAIYPALAAIFVAQFFDVHLSITDYLLIALVSVIGSAATAGVTGAVVMLTLTLSTLGLPLAGVGLLLAIDPILDMGRTAVNVAGQALVPTIVAKREGILDVERYRSTSTVDPLARVEENDGVDADLRRARHRLRTHRDARARSSAEGRARRRLSRSRSAQPDSSGSSGRKIDRPAGAVGGRPTAWRRSPSRRPPRSACAWSPVAVTQPTSGRPPVGSPGSAGPGQAVSGGGEAVTAGRSRARRWPRRRPARTPPSASGGDAGQRSPTEVAELRPGRLLVRR